MNIETKQKLRQMVWIFVGIIVGLFDITAGIAWFISLIIYLIAFDRQTETEGGKTQWK